MRLADVVATSERVRATSSRNGKVALLAELLAPASPDEARLVVAWLSGYLPQGRIGLGPAALEVADRVPASARPVLGIEDVDRAFTAIHEVAGAGSKGERERRLADLFARATAGERFFLVALLGGGLRQGALEGVVLEALARARGVDAAVVRRAAMLCGDLPETARILCTEGAAGLDRFRVTLFRPVSPMLAETAEGPEAALADFGRAVFDAKLDGARIQVHRAGDDVRVWTRSLQDVTARVPEVVAIARALPVREAILDGEVLALGEDGRPRPFQTTMSRFGRRRDLARTAAEIPLSPRFFDALLADGEPLLDRPTEERLAALDRVVPAAWRVPRVVTADPAVAGRFVEEVLASGHEGVMAKDPGASYEAGRRGAAWRKIKRARTLDLVVLAAEWGSGRRVGYLSNLHLGARDPSTGGFAMVGKTFKGLTDELLAWQTRAFLEREVSREGHVVRVRPDLVVEVAFEGVQASPRYASGVALRFARVRRYRPDRTAADADTIEAVRASRPRLDA
jgi:DNA ligase-1